MVRRTHMAAAGIDPEEEARIERMAQLAEQDAARLLGGEWVPPGQENATRGDVRFTDGTYVEVKFTTWRGAVAEMTVNLGRSRPPARRILVYRERPPGTLVVAGWLDRDRRGEVNHGIPPGYTKPQPCYWAAGSSVTPYQHPIGTPLGDPRLCPACAEWHAAGTTCAGGWAPQQPQFPWD